MTTRISYSPVEAAKVLGVSRAYMYVLLARGEIPARKIGTRTLIAAADLQAFLNRQPLAQFTSVHTTAAA
jgi:excisionase family DNA binding protein